MDIQQVRLSMQPALASSAFLTHFGQTAGFRNVGIENMEAKLAELEMPYVYVSFSQLSLSAKGDLLSQVKNQGHPVTLFRSL